MAGVSKSNTFIFIMDDGTHRIVEACDEAHAVSKLVKNDPSNNADDKIITTLELRGVNLSIIDHSPKVTN